MSTPIPGPRGYPILGNMLDLQDEVPLDAIGRMIDVYGPIVKFTVPGSGVKIVVGSYELFNELCDETRFYKLLSGLLVEGSLDPEARGAEGLFTARSEQSEDWAQAHRILLPAFGPLAIEEMFPEMHDIASQMVLKWARQGSQHRVSVTEDFSRLTLDTIALCAMDYRFNSFYTEDTHSFVKSMNNILTERNNAIRLGGMLKNMMPSYRAKIRQDNELNFAICQEVVDHRRQNPTERKDLLNAMLYGKDPKTGQAMRDRLIAVNMQTFLIAGHETTSGLLSFAMLQMLKNPSTFFAARQEVDAIIGNDRITPAHLKELKYINAMLRETLRLSPTAPAFQRAVRPSNSEDVVMIGGKYEIPHGQSIICNLMKIHTDPKIWGDDANEFKPERMMDGKFENLPRNAWKPFGTGSRSCIGRAFAWQEALLAVAMILQNFNVELADPDYELRIVQSLTIKPKDFYIRVCLRSGITPTALQRRLQSLEEPDDTKQVPSGRSNGGDDGGDDDNATVDMAILYGSNTGTCQGLAQRLMSQAAQHGIKASVDNLDAATDNLPKNIPVVIIVASYEGLPPDNAARFIAWLEHLGNGNSLDGLQFAVLGCGHSDWVSTYQRIPTLVDDLLANSGAHRMTQRGLIDMNRDDISKAWELWTGSKLWPAISSTMNIDLASNGSALPVIEADLHEGDRTTQLQQNVQWANVVRTKSLTTMDKAEKWQCEFELPRGLTYETGDYLAVLPLNNGDTVRRVTRRFGLSEDSCITIKKSGSTTLPVGRPIPVFDLLRGYVELSSTATRKEVELLAASIRRVEEREQAQLLAGDDATFKKEIADRRTSVLDLLERFPGIAIPFETYLGLLPPLRLRYYSISSSPLVDPSHCTLTYTVIEGPSWSGSEYYQGVASTYLRGLRPGDKALVSVRSTNKYFRLPADQESTPIVMLCSGSGIAPFRAFIQERAYMMKEGGRKLAPALLFVGCRFSGRDRLYGDELDDWQRLGAVDVRYAFSEDPDSSRGCKYVQDRLLHDKADVLDMWDKGSRFYVCGGNAMAEGISQVTSELFMKRSKELGKEATAEDVDEFKQRMRNERFISDIFD